MGVLEHRAGLDHAGAGFFDIGGVGRLQPGDLAVLVGDQGRPVEASGREWSSRSLRRPRSRGWICEARPKASSARSRGSRRCRPCGIPRRPWPWRDGRPRSRRRDTAGAASDHEEIDVEFSHDVSIGSLNPKRNARRMASGEPAARSACQSHSLLRHPQICLSRFLISPRNSPSTVSANLIAHWFI